jgi:radical SAM protein with 4Fe4S-binding SPASM domain
VVIAEELSPASKLMSWNVTGIEDITKRDQKVEFSPSRDLMMDKGNHKPRLIFWEVTKGCNLRCIHCRATATELSSPLDLPTTNALKIIKQVSQYALPILVLSGGEPLFRADIFELARFAAECGLRVALATNGTLVTKEVARKIVEAGVRRVSISLDGSNAATHDAFRGIPGAFDAALRGFRNLKELGMSVQINMSIARHNAHELPAVLEMAKSIGADALHTFLLVPVGCGVDIAESQMVPADEYERILNWFYDRAQEGGIELKATCAPHYFRVMRQRRAAEKRAASSAPRGHVAPLAARPGAIGPTEMTMPGSTGMALHPHGAPGGTSHAAGHPGGMNAVTKGCLAGSGVCFISHVGEVYPCGYLPVRAGDLRRQSFAEIWEKSEVFQELRDTGNLKGKCGYCEFRNICMGCRARAYAATGDYLAEEPFCVYQPRMADPRVSKDEVRHASATRSGERAKHRQ